MEPATTIGNKIRTIRDSLNLSQQRFGCKIGVSGKTISAYENGRIDPPYKVIKKISKVFNVPIYELPKEQKVSLVSKVQDIESNLMEIKKILELEITNKY